MAYRDVERWRQVIDTAKPIVDFYLALVTREEDLATGSGKARAIERLAPVILEIANPIERTHYIQVVARAIQVDERLVADQISRGGRLEERRAQASAEESAQRRGAAGSGRKRFEAPPDFGPEEYILGWLFLRPELLGGLDEEMIGQQAPPLGPDDLSSALNQALLAALLAQMPVPPDMELEERLSELAEPLHTRAQAAVAEVRKRPPLTDEKLIKDLGDSLLRIRERNLKRQVQQLEFLIRDTTAADDREEIRRLRELMTTYTAQKRYIQKLLNMRSIAGVLARSEGRASVILGSSQRNRLPRTESKGEVMPTNAERRRSTPRPPADALKEEPAPDVLAAVADQPPQGTTRQAGRPGRPPGRGAKTDPPVGEPAIAAIIEAADPIEGEPRVEVRVAVDPDGQPVDVLPPFSDDGKVPAIPRDIGLEQEVEREARKPLDEVLDDWGDPSRDQRSGQDVPARDRPHGIAFGRGRSHPGECDPCGQGSGGSPEGR